jgi:hypothetical protein
MRIGRSKSGLLPVLALYQVYWTDTADHYLTAALMRQAEEWLVVGLDGEFRGEWEITLHDRLEDARAAIVAWVGEAREVDASSVPAHIWERINQLRLTGSLAGDPLNIPSHPI